VQHKSEAWMVAGGVGVPPMLWLSEALAAAGKRAVAFCGARSKDLFPLSIDPQTSPSPQTGEAGMACEEFARNGVPVVLSTDDGSIGLAGHVGDALVSYHQANPVDPSDVVVYACGPERMLELVAGYSTRQGMECYVCLERTMACGTGACQSCVVPLHAQDAPEGWRYHLCCTDGPVFEANRVIWKLNDGAQASADLDPRQPPPGGRGPAG
jgi:dihydroorotate dehydrogenase electron transfer subunit